MLSLGNNFWRWQLRKKRTNYFFSSLLIAFLGFTVLKLIERFSFLSNPATQKKKESSSEKEKPLEPKNEEKKEEPKKVLFIYEKTLSELNPLGKIDEILKLGIVPMAITREFIYIGDKLFYGSSDALSEVGKETFGKVFSKIQDVSGMNLKIKFFIFQNSSASLVERMNSFLDFWKIENEKIFIKNSSDLFGLEEPYFSWIKNILEFEKLVNK